MKLSAVCCGRNDNYGGHFLDSALYSINSMLKTFDEVIYVDWNTEEGKKIVTDELHLENRDKLRVFHITPDLVKKITNGTPTPPMCEVLARNIGIRKATGDIIFSVNPDLIIAPREQIDLMCQNLKMGDMITLTKQDVELDDLKKQLLAVFETECIGFVTAWEYAERYTKSIGRDNPENDRFLVIIQALTIWINAKNLGVACGEEIPESIRSYIAILREYFGIEIEHLLK